MKFESMSRNSNTSLLQIVFIANRHTVIRKKNYFKPDTTRKLRQISSTLQSVLIRTNAFVFHNAIGFRKRAPYSDLRLLNSTSRNEFREG